MQIVQVTLLLLVTLVLGLALATRVAVWIIEYRHPPVGEFATVNGTRLHYVFDRAGKDADLAPVVFLHGASGNLADQATAFRERLAGRADMLFIDRPGHGWSERGPESNAWPDGQAATIATLLDELGIDRAIVVGHSFGGAIAVSFALNHPDRTEGMLLLAPVSHPWPGGVDWYYELAPKPVLGHLFSETLVLPFGLLRLRPGTEAVFSPNLPPEGYVRRTGVALVLRPFHFRANAADVDNLYDYVARTAPRYREISSPAVIITGDKDTIVLPRVHSLGLERDLRDAELLWVRNLGHKPDYAATGLAIAALEKLSGKPRDLQALRRELETRIAADRNGPLHRSLGDVEPEPVLSDT